MAWGDSVRKLGGELKKLNDELVATRTEFAGLKERFVESIDQFKRIVERSADRMDQIEKEHIRERAELAAKIDGLSERLNSLSERAIHQAVQDIAEDLVSRKLASGEIALDGRSEKKKIEGHDASGTE